MAGGKPGRPKKNIDKKEITDVVVKKDKVIKKKRELNEVIEVKSISQAPLYYVTTEGFDVVWPNHGDVNYLEYKELINMSGKYKRYFTEPWIIMEQDVLEDLRVTQHYKKMIDYENIDSVFKKSPEELKKTLQAVSDGTKRLIADRATALIKERKLDSLNLIEVLQQELKVELI